MGQSVYKITTDQGEYHVTVEDAQTPLDAHQSHIGPGPQTETGDVMLDNVKNLGMGALKSAARVGQMIPGVARATDAIYGLPHGASVASTQPSNTGERIGGYVADAALATAIGAADVPVQAVNGVRMIPKQVGPVLAQKALQTGGAALDALGSISAGAVSAAKAGLIGTGPLTADKIGRLIGRYGVKAVKVAAEGLGLGAAIDAWMQLKK